MISKILMSKLVGIIFFSSSILLTTGVRIASIPFINMFNKNKKLKNKAERESISEPGKLVLPNARSFFGIGWRNGIRFSSPDECEGGDCEMEIINNFDETILVCWIEPNGTLRNFYPINDGSIKDGSVSNKHLEYTFKNHAFVIIRQSDPLPKKVKDIKRENFLFSYVPYKASHRHRLIIQKPVITATSQFMGRKIVDVTLTCEKIEVDEDNQLIVTADKQYLSRSLCGFTVNYESGVFDSCSALEAALVEDLTQLNTLLPPAAAAKLQAGTPLWINKTFTYGTTKKPIEGIHINHTLLISRIMFKASKNAGIIRPIIINERNNNHSNKKE